VRDAPDTYLLGDDNRLDKLLVEAVAELADAAGDLVKMDRLLVAVALDNVHVLQSGKHMAVECEGTTTRKQAFELDSPNARQ
jgi:hypothetical protein